MRPKKIFRITTVPISLKLLLTDQMRYMSSHGYDVTMISAEGKEIQELITTQKCPHIVVRFTRKITPFQDLMRLITLIKLFRQEQPDIVHTHTPKAGLLGMLAAKFSRVPLRIHTIAGLPLMTTSGLKRQLLIQIEKLTYWGAQEIWPNSHSIYNYMLQHNLCSKNKMKIIGKGSTNGIDLDIFSPTKIDAQTISQLKLSIDYNEHSTYLLAVGRVVVDKGIVELIQAFMELNHDRPDLKLILLGTLEEERAEEILPADILAQINNHPDIIHINWSDEVAYYMELADVLIHASHREGFPNVVLQAGAMNLPIVCSRIPGNIDIVEHLETGYLFEMANIEQLIEGLKWTLENSKIISSQTQKLRKRIEENFDRKVMHRLILEEYKKNSTTLLSS